MGHSVQVAGNTGCLYLMGNCIPYYEIREREWILMDCGSRLARTQLAEYLSKNKISVRAVLCSHGHYDHTENNRFLQEEYGAELVMSCLDAGILQDTLSLKTVFYSNTLQDNERECSDMLCKADQMILPARNRFRSAAYSSGSFPSWACSQSYGLCYAGWGGLSGRQHV